MGSFQPGFLSLCRLVSTQLGAAYMNRDAIIVVVIIVIAVVVAADTEPHPSPLALPRGFNGDKRPCCRTAPNQLRSHGSRITPDKLSRDLCSSSGSLCYYGPTHCINNHLWVTLRNKENCFRSITPHGQWGETEDSRPWQSYSLNSKKGYSQPTSHHEHTRLIQRRVIPNPPPTTNILV